MNMQTQTHSPTAATITAKDPVRNDPSALFRKHAENMASNVVCTMLELAGDSSRAQEAAALAEADGKHPDKARALDLNPAEASKTQPDTSSDTSPPESPRA